MKVEYFGWLNAHAREFLICIGTLQIWGHSHALNPNVISWQDLLCSFASLFSSLLSISKTRLQV